jgi:two-component system, NtrC family, response regulator AtoC
MDALCNYSWPGNVREFRNLLERTAILHESHILLRKNFFPDHINEESDTGSWSVPFPARASYNDTVDDYMRYLIKEALRSSKGNKVKAARLLGMSRGALYKQMETLGMDVSKQDS